MIRKISLLTLLAFNAVYSQDVNHHVYTTAKGILYTEEKNPFWIYSNQRGRIDEKTNLAAWITGEGIYELRDVGVVRTGLGVLYSDGIEEGIKLDEFYVSYENNWFEAFAGRKQEEELFHGLSATNEHLLWSLNARPISGVGVETNRPVMFWERAGLGFEASWAEYFSDEKERYIQVPRIHHKSFKLVYTGIRNLEIVAGLQHYVQWAGESPEHGELPSGFEDYLRVVSGGSLSGGTGFVGESEINGLGNHLGGYLASVETSWNGYGIFLLYNTIFEDMSGIKWRNKPDGRYSIYIENPEENRWVEALMYEYYFTRHQSKTYPTPDGKDNYFNNHLYKSGWTYQKAVIGLPFILLNEEKTRVAHNNIVAHHVGVAGQAFYTYPYRLLLSYRENYGSKSGSPAPLEKVLSTYLNVNVLDHFINIDFQVGVDFHFEESSKVGFGITVSRIIL